MARNWLGAAVWAKKIDDWERSGLSLPKFCQQHGLKKATMSGWVYKPALKQAIEMVRRGQENRGNGPVKTRPDPTSTPTPAFLPVRLRAIISGASTEPIQRSAIEVIVAAGRRVSVQRGFDPETLRQVVATLESGSC